jgi:Berberine and berberine like
MMFEYYPLSKFSTVPDEETAFRRDPTSSVLILVEWKQDADTYSESAPMVEKAKALAHELCDVMVGNGKTRDGATNVRNTGYGNYGESFHALS